MFTPESEHKEGANQFFLDFKIDEMVIATIRTAFLGFLTRSA